MWWERADPPWELPNYVSEFAWALEETQAWITNGGVAAPVTTVPLWIVPPTNPTLPTPSNGESGVGASNEELLTPKCLMDKGLWATPLAMHIGWKIFIDVSWAFPFLGWP